MASKVKMTNLVAIQNYIEPYELSEGKLGLLLMEQGLQSDGEYNVETDRIAMIRAVIEALYSVISLVEESDNGSKQRYDVDAIENLIKHYRRKIGDDSDEQKARVRDATREGIW